MGHHLSEETLMDRISICDSLYKRNEKIPFFKQVVKGGKKWTIYNNVEEEILGKVKYTTFGFPKSRSSSKGSHAPCLMGLQRNPVL